MNRVAERVQLPNQTGPGPHQTWANWLMVALQTFIAEIARRLNLCAPKDGSELVQMTSLDKVVFAISGDVNNADPGYYSVVKCVLTGADRTLTGIVDGAGQEDVGGRVLTLVNASATALNLIVAHENGSSSAANRFLLPRSLPVSIAQYMSMTFWYDLDDSRWRPL